MTLWMWVVVTFVAIVVLGCFANTIAWYIGRTAAMICPPKPPVIDTTYYPEVEAARQEYLKVKKELDDFRRTQKKLKKPRKR